MYLLKSKISSTILSLAFLLGIIAPLMVAVPAQAAACTTPSPSYGTDSLSVSVPSTTTYVIWTRLKAPAATSNEILLQVDTSNCYTVGGSSSIPVNSWTWVNYQNGNTGSVISLSLSSGTHTFKYIGNETGVGVDRTLLLTPGDPCVPPTGTGSNCPASSSSSSSSSGSSSSSSSSGSGSSSSSSSSGGGSSSGSSSSSSSSGGGSSSGSGVTIKPVAGQTSVISSSGQVTVPVVQGSTVQSGSVPLTLVPTTASSSQGQVTKVQYYLNNKLIHTASSAPFDYKINTGNLRSGTYKLETKTTYSSGNVVTQTATLVVKHTFLREAWLLLRNYALILLIVVALAVGFALWRRRRMSTPGDSNFSTGINPDIHVSAPPQVITPQT